MIQKDAEQESEMRTEIHEMKKEQSSISMMDEFAKYARLERKINKTTDKLKTHGEMQMTVRDSQIGAGVEPRLTSYSTHPFKGISPNMKTMKIESVSNFVTHVWV